MKSIDKKANKTWSVPLGKGLPRGVQHTPGGHVQETHFAAQNLHRVSVATPADLHLPQVVGIAAAVLSDNRMS